MDTFEFYGYLAALFVVGVTAFWGAIRNIQKGMIDYRVGIAFAVPSFIAIYITRKYLFPAIPDKLFLAGDFLFTKNAALMVFFAVVMLIAALYMIKDKKIENEENSNIQYNYLSLSLQGFIIGVLTGILGVGGGFLYYSSFSFMDWTSYEKSCRHNITYYSS